MKGSEEVQHMLQELGYEGKTGGGRGFGVVVKWDFRMTNLGMFSA